MDVFPTSKQTGKNENLQSFRIREKKKCANNTDDIPTHPSPWVTAEITSWMMVP
jgi:hypothetical protein